VHREASFAAATTLVLFAGLCLAETITINTEPAHAGIYRLDSHGEGTLIGTGSARLKLEKDSPNQVKVTADGYEPVIQAFPKGNKYAKVVQISLKNRLVKLNVLPYDAQIFHNGALLGSQSAEIVVPPDASTTVEVRRPGFKTEMKTYHNQAGSDIPPVADRIDLGDRLVLLTTNPSGCSISIDGALMGENSADVVVPRGRCAVVKVAKQGFAPVEKTYCNSEQAPEPPLNDSITMRNRVVAVIISPSEAELKVNGRVVGRGEFQVSVNEGLCADVVVALEGFVTEKRQYCNQTNAPVPPAEEHFQLALDEAFSISLRSDQANVNFTLEVNPTRTVDQAWKTIFQVVVNHFDVIEMSDKETGYLRTAWKVRNFPHNTIRTRVICYLGDAAPLKYIIKIQSEYSGEANTSVKCDDCFHEWDRVLSSYKDIITELQARLT